MSTFLYSAADAIKKLFGSIINHFRRDLAPGRRANFFSRYIIGLSIFYYEILFKLSTTKTPYGIAIVYILLFSLAFGLIGTLLTTFFKPSVNRTIRRYIILALMFPYGIEYFVYRQFKTFYDLKTVTNGAGGVITGFFGHILKLIFSPSGLLHVFLLLLPYLVYIYLIMHHDPAKRTSWRRKLSVLITLVIMWFAAWVLIMANSKYRRIYSKEYNFQSAVSDFGLLTGIRLDIKRSLFGGSSISFDPEDSSSQGGIIINPGTNESSGETETETEAETEKVYGKNELDIDFAELAENSSGTNADMDAYLATLTPSSQNEYTGLFEGKNLIMITAEAFSGDIIDEELTPTLYRLANKGIQISDYIMPATAGTTGGEFEHIFGMYPMDGGASMMDTLNYTNLMTMGSQLSRLGYYGKAYHNNDYTYYSRDLTHFNLGYSDGYMGYGNGMEEYVTAQWPESDLEMFEGTVPTYINKQPFNIYYMTVSGHSNYSYASNAMAKKNWDKVAYMEEEGVSEAVTAYYACNLELENALTYLVDELEKAGIADDTVIVITADHFPYGLDDDAALGHMPYLSELYGYDVTNYLQRDHNRLIIWSGCLEDMDPIVVDTPVSVIDILPTLSNLFGTEFDSRLFPGRDIFSDAEAIAFNTARDWKTEKGTYIADTGEFTPNDPNEEVSDEYISRIRSIVNNKLSFMYGFVATDYYEHVLGDYDWKTLKPAYTEPETEAPAETESETETEAAD
ncbi:MAG: sulfatase-like hydrolase/transferase [Lachnospiraceae bacterium]|nr:sulfatase-like hydrolase/transferase [Lachnospiraceae bacterium]